MYYYNANLVEINSINSSETTLTFKDIKVMSVILISPICLPLWQKQQYRNAGSLVQLKKSKNK